MIKRALLTSLWAVAAVCAVSAPALAHGVSAAGLGGGGPDGVPRAVEKVLGGDVKLLDNGLYRVRSGQGFSYTTHGPDFGPDIQRPFGDLRDVVTPAAERTPICATDFYQEVLYAYPSSGTNDLAANKAAIQAQIRTMNDLLNSESLASGGLQADYKVLCESGEIKVSAFSVPSGDPTATFNEIVAAAKTAGYGDGTTDTNVDYTIFYDGPGDAGACGVGYLYFDDSKSVNNANNNPAGLEAGYGVSFDGCWFGRTTMHENGHNQGAVQQGAPNSTGDGGHCNEDTDVLCYLDGGNLNQNYPQPCVPAPGTGSLRYDCAWNSYFDAAPESSEWLDTHWNIGWTGNRFIQFGGPDVTDPDTTILSGPSGPTADSTPTFTFQSTELNSTFKCDIDDATPDVQCNSGSFTPATPLLDGPHTFYVAATDSSGNEDDSPDSRPFSVDATAPDTLIDSAPTGTITVNTATIEFSSPDVSATFQCKLDAALFATCTNPAQLNGLSEGAHTFQVRARDALLNTDPTPASATFTVDLPSGGGGGGSGGGDQDPPETTLTGTPPAKVKVKKTAKVTFSFASDEPGTFSCRFDGGAATVCASPQQYKQVAKGQHTFAVEAIDAAGNVDATAASYSFKVKKKKKRK